MCVCVRLYYSTIACNSRITDPLFARPGTRAAELGVCAFVCRRVGVSVRRCVYVRVRVRLRVRVCASVCALAQ